jgi:hypothetical protein
VILGPWAVAMLRGIHRIAERSIWLDESASIFVAEAAPEDFFRVLSGSKLNKSLYFALLRPWTALGSGDRDRTDYRGPTAAVGRNAQPGDGIAWWTPSHARPSVYYVRRLGLEGMPQPVGTAVSWESNPYARQAVSTWPSGSCLPRIWLVDGPRNLEGRPYPGRRGELVALLADYETSGTASRFGNLKLRLFELGDGAPLPACSPSGIASAPGAGRGRLALRVGAADAGGHG